MEKTLLREIVQAGYAGHLKKEYPEIIEQLVIMVEDLSESVERYERLIHLKTSYNGEAGDKTG